MSMRLPKLSSTPNGLESVSGVADLSVSCTPAPAQAQGLTASVYSVYRKILLCTALGTLA